MNKCGVVGGVVWWWKGRGGGGGFSRKGPETRQYSQGGMGGGGHRVLLDGLSTRYIDSLSRLYRGLDYTGAYGEYSSEDRSLYPYGGSAVLYRI